MTATQRQNDGKPGSRSLSSCLPRAQFQQRTNQRSANTWPAEAARERAVRFFMYTIGPVCSCYRCYCCRCHCYCCYCYCWNANSNKSIRAKCGQLPSLTWLMFLDEAMTCIKHIFASKRARSQSSAHNDIRITLVGLKQIWACFVKLLTKSWRFSKC